MTDYKQLCAELLTGYETLLGDLIFDNRLAKRARAALAESEPELEPTLREEFTMILNEARCNSTGRVIGNIELGRRLVKAVEQFMCAQPEPEGPTDDELFAVAEAYVEDNGLIGLHNAPDFARAVLARWGNHPESPDSSLQPVSVAERLPGPGDCDAEGLCWVWNTTAYTWGLFRLDLTVHSHWLPAHALPLPSSGEGEA